MSKADDYRAYLRSHDDWVEYLRQESGLPGPRANLELAALVAEEGDTSFFQRCLSYDEDGSATNNPPTNNSTEYLIFCGVVGYGKLLSKGDETAMPILRRYASDGRWRLREGVALGLQYLGALNMPALIAEMEDWSQGNRYEQRAAAAALCEPKLLQCEVDVVNVLKVLDAITLSIPQEEDRKSDAFVALRKGLGYCWSVAVAAAPQAGKAMMDHWLASTDADIRWIMRENLKKNRLTRMDAAWVAEAQQQLVAG